MTNVVVLESQKIFDDNSRQIFIMDPYKDPRFYRAAIHLLRATFSTVKPKSN